MDKKDLFHEANVAEVISWGYEIADCNDEGLTDFGEAVLLAHENGCMALPSDEQREEFRAAFKKEFS